MGRGLSVALLMKQKKEKKKQMQQARSQLEGAVKEGCARIMKESEGRLETIQRKNDKRAEVLKGQLEEEMKMLAMKKQEFEKETREGFGRIQILQTQIAALQKEIEEGEESKRIVERCGVEMKKMQERLNAEYARKRNAIRKKSNTKKRNEIQVETEMKYQK